MFGFLKRKRKPKKMFYKFVFVDLTTSKTPAHLAPAPVFDKFIANMTEQLDVDYAEEYGIPSYTFRIATGPHDRKSDEIAVNFRDTIPEAPTALAYHTVTNGIPDIEMGCDLFDNLLDESGMLSGLSHEILELLRDEGANGWKDTYKGFMNAEELCDFVQNTGYRAKAGGWVSNFVRANFFVPGSKGPWDFMGLMKDQDDYSNGYGVRCDPSSNVSQVHGMQQPSKGVHTVGVIKKKIHPWSRSYRRGVRQS